MKYCPNCSSPLPDGSKFCSTCGATLETDETAGINGNIEDTAEQTSYDQVSKQQDDIEVAPIISDQSFDQQYGGYEQQTYDQQYGGYEQQTYDQQYSSYEQQAYDQQYSGYEQQTYDQQYSGYEQQSYDQQYGSYEQQAYDQQAQSFSQPVQSQPLQSFDQPQMPNEQPKGFHNPDYINPASPQMPGVVPGKGGSSLIVPIILIILIIAVILIDVFWLFRDQIWGKKDDSSSTTTASYVIDE
jgi:hypothetical protein